MANNCKRFLSLLLALVMVIGLMPMGHVHAEEGTTVKAPEAEPCSDLGLVNIGDSAEFVIVTGQTDRTPGVLNDGNNGQHVSSQDGRKTGIELLNAAVGSINADEYPNAFWTITKVEDGYTIGRNGSHVMIKGDNYVELVESSTIQIRVSANASYGNGYWEIYNTDENGSNHYLNYFDSFGNATSSGWAACSWNANGPGSQWKLYKVTEKTVEVDPWDKASWTKVHVDTETVHNATEGLFEYAFDGKLNTIWHSNWNGARDVLTGENEFAGEIDFGKEYTINQFSFLPRQDDTGWVNGDGVVTMASLYVKDADDTEWQMVAEHVEFEHNQQLKTFNFEARNVRYVRFEAERSVNDGWVAVAEFYINYEEQPTVHEHSYEAVVTAPTCTEGGYTTYTCECGDSYIADETEALGHDYQAVVTEPDCENGGYTTYTCSVCGDSYVADETAALGHSFGEWTVTTAPTCTEAGVETRTCACGETETRAVEALGHDYETVVTEPDCENGGYTTYTCTRCGDSYVADETAALGHSFGKWVVTTAPTCTEAGVETRTCACGETETRAVEALGHDYEAVVTEPDCENGGYTTYTCTRCGDSYVADETAALGHEYEDGFCIRCGEADPSDNAVIAEGWSGYTTWVLTSDGTITFTSSGEKLPNGESNLKNYWKVDGVLSLPWGEYADMITKVVINEGIHDIGQMAFYELPNLTEVVLPESAVEIRGYAFKNCAKLTTINLEVVDFIREGAFYGCSALQNIQFAEGVVIEDWAFTRTPVAVP